MARNTLADLNNHLFAQLERLGEEDISPDQLEIELKRAKALNGVSKNIIENAKLALEGAKFQYETLPGDKQAPEQFRIKNT